MVKKTVWFWRPRGFRNFGDELGLFILQRFAEKRHLHVKFVRDADEKKAAVFSVGSVLHRADGRSKPLHVWSTGCMPKPVRLPRFTKLWAIRGPLTLKQIKAFNPHLQSARPAFGDGALILPRLVPRAPVRVQVSFGIVPHFTD